MCDVTELADVICDAANLGPAAGATCVRWPQDTSVQSEAGCTLVLPNVVDELRRQIPDFTFAGGSLPVASADECVQLDMQLLGGPTTVAGWYVLNPDQTQDQFLALAGVQLP
jgi:hypothetical protein